MSIGKGKGIATFYKSDLAQHELDCTENNLQVTKFTSSNIDIISVYRSSNCNSVELLNKISKITSIKKSVIITGDFNICYLMNKTNRLIQGLESNGFQQLVRESTHIRGRHIDHAYWKDADRFWLEPVLNRYSPYYSDHDAICLTITRNDKERNQT